MSDIIEMFKYLLSVDPHLVLLGSENKRKPRLGNLSRRFCLKKAIEFPYKNVIPSGDLLLDYNKNKLEVAERLFNIKLNLLNPREFSFPISYRFVFILLLILTNRLRLVLFHMLMVNYLQRIIPIDKKIYIINPYSIFHYSITFLKNKRIAFLNNCKRPKFNADFYYSFKPILDAYGITNKCHYLYPPTINFVDNKKCVYFYFSALKKKGFLSEDYLREFSQYIYKNIDLPMNVWLHRYDGVTEKTKKKMLENGLESILPTVKSVEHSAFHDSLSMLSTNQISFSAMSSIWPKLLSSNIDHFVFYCQQDLEIFCPELLIYAQSSDRFVSIENSFAEICELTGLDQYRMDSSNKI